MIINTTDGLSQAIQELKREGNLLYPLNFCDAIAPMHRVSIRRVSIDPDKDMGEVYHPAQVAAGKFALTKIGLLKIDLASGLEWMPEFCHRVDNGGDQFYVKFMASARIQDLDGTYRTVSAESSLDYRDGAIAIEGLTKNDIRMRRMSIVQRAETAAKNRVRRDAIGIKPVYTVDELKRPFIVLKLVKNIPAKYDNAMAAQLLGVDQSIFGSDVTISNVEVSPPEPEVSVVDDTNPVQKSDLIDQITKLYLQKIGTPRQSNRAPLADLSMNQLEEVMRTLIAMPDKR